MKIMRSMLTLAVRIWHSSAVRYSLVVALGVLVVGFAGENSLWAILRNKIYINELTEEINKHNARSREDVRLIRELDRNPKAIERIARERYFMKHDDEDIFVLSDDVRLSQTAIEHDETAE